MSCTLRPTSSGRSQQTRETVGLGIVSADEMIFVYRERGPQPATLNAEIGARRPLHCTAAGQAYLAALPPDECRALLRRIKLDRYTPMVASTAEAISRRLGYAPEFDSRRR